MGKQTLLLLPLAALAFAPAADGDVHAAAKTLRIKAKGGGNTAFNKATLSAPAGKVTIVMKNPQSSFLEHGVAIKGKKGKVVQPGGKSTVSAKLEPGRYTYFCPVAGHRAGGMKGKLTVE
jgi:plastocyanin